MASEISYAIAAEIQFESPPGVLFWITSEDSSKISSVEISPRVLSEIPP